MERKALIFNVQKYSIYDGPGVRTLVFFKGCPLRCRWCSNPESQNRQYQVMLKKNLCKNHGTCIPVCPVEIHSMSPEGIHLVSQQIDCLGCRRCEEVCPERALAIVGELKTISELMQVIEEDRLFYENSGGGVTLGGGEVLSQPEAAINLLMACKQSGFHTAIETCGYALPETIMKVAEFTDLFLYDIKHMDSSRHYEATGVHNERILNNLKWLLDNKYNVKVRVPLLKGVNDGEDNIHQMAQFLKPYEHHKNFQGIDILPYHKLGVNKYYQLDREYPVTGDPSLSSADIEVVKNILTQYDLNVTVIHH
ncbi:choline TMA-lyase-activating enzyme [Neisseria sp. Ec49-e6-T10]|uniref:choline TMA-lyase-activating enzyme n=1 Tax=Neisseria sp. Ec49-e6-T10 TaxID=3140744 RepID=UPI003EBFCCDA